MDPYTEAAERLCFHATGGFYENGRLVFASDDEWTMGVCELSKDHVMKIQTWIAGAIRAAVEAERAALIEFCHGRVLYNGEQQQARFSGNDVQRIKCMQSRASEAALIRDHIRSRATEST